MKRSLMLLAVLVGLGLTAAPALADQIFVQQSGTSPAGGDPNQITDPGSFVVGVAGHATGEDPLLVIVGVYDGNGMPSLTFGTTVEPLALVGTYHITADPETNSSGDEYKDIGLTPETNSESFGNWSGEDVKLGLAPPTSFTLYAFELSGVELNGTITLGESGAAKGSFIIAYDCKDDKGDCSLKNHHGDIMDTPFTNAGVISTAHVVPEPASLLLFGSGLLGLASRLRRRGR